MSTFAALSAFTLAAGLLTMTPGLDSALVLRTVAAEGPRRAALAALGIGCGVLAWGVIGALGFGALLAASRLAYTALQWTGAAYLFYLGVGMVLRPREGFDVARGADASSASTSTRNWFVRGLMTNLLNPKVGVFYVTFLPQLLIGEAR